MTDLALGVRRAAWGVRALAVVLGAVLVALAAQVSIPLPGTPVPMTLQPMARLLGPTGGYLLAYPIAAWAVGRFADPGRQPGENPSGAWVPNNKPEVGRVSVNPGLPPGVSEPWLRVTIGVVVGLVLIHVGGLAQLAILTGSISGAARLATWPFLLGDVLKLVILVPVLTRLTPTIRARL